MRFFYESHMSHQYALSLAAVQQHVQSHIDPTYSEVQCEQDLKQLVAWGNLRSEQDRSRARTVEEFLRRQDIYYINPYGVAFERMLKELEAARGSGGSLDPTLLDELLDALEQLAALLGEANDRVARAAGNGTLRADHRHAAAKVPFDPAVLAEASLAKINRTWQRGYEAFDRLGRQASDYLSTLHRSQDDELTDLDAFLAYKDILLQYLETFVTGLFDQGERIKSLIGRLQPSGFPERLPGALAYYEQRYTPTADGRIRELDELRPRYRHEWGDVARWFQATGGYETLRRQTLATISAVARRSQRLMDRRTGMSRRRELERLAVAFADLELADAHRLAGLAFAAMTPLHLQGSAEGFMMSESGSVWTQEALEVGLKPVRRGGGGARARSAPVADRRAEQRRALTLELERRQAEAARWDALFAGGRLQLGDLRLSDPELRRQLLHVLARCLATPDGRTVIGDGSTITLEWPTSTEPGLLSAPDGTLALPRFVLHRETARLAASTPAGTHPAPTPVTTEVLR